jgi:dTDP-4-dehydrorhamnose 3,5-epimerase
MKILKTKFKGLLVINSMKFIDSRGFFRELLQEKLIKKRFIFNVVSVSKKNVIRGMHLQRKKSQGKFISVIKGSILDVVIDLRKNSKTFGKHYKIILNDKNCKSVYVPEGFAHGFLGLSKENIVVYSCTNYRNKESETGLIWNDKNLKITWPIKKPILSSKDRNNITLQNFINQNG